MRTPPAGSRAYRRHLRKHAERLASAAFSETTVVAGNGAPITDPLALALLRKAAVSVLKTCEPVLLTVPEAAAAAFDTKPTDAPVLGMAIDIDGRFTWTCRPRRELPVLVLELAALCGASGHPVLWAGVAGHA